MLDPSLETDMELLTHEPSPASPRRKSSALSLRRSSSKHGEKPTFGWMGSEGVGELSETVGVVWGIPRDVLDRDVAAIRKSGSLDKVGSCRPG
jgi:hypothetical protein